MQLKRKRLGLIGLALLATAVPIYLAGGLSPSQLEAWLHWAGPWAPLIYVLVYAVATVLVFPSTPLNLLGGALFGPWLGTLWTTVAAVIAATLSFSFSRTIGRDWATRRLAGQWQMLDTELQRGALLYMIAVRLQPVIPYGLVNFAAGLTSIRFRDYVIGTTLGTPPGVLPFVFLGSFGLRALKTGEVLPLLIALGVVAGLVVIAARSRRPADPVSRRS